MTIRIELRCFMNEHIFSRLIDMFLIELDEVAIITLYQVKENNCKSEENSIVDYLIERNMLESFQFIIGTVRYKTLGFWDVPHI